MKPMKNDKNDEKMTFQVAWERKIKCHNEMLLNYTQICQRTKMSVWEKTKNAIVI